MDDVSEFRKWLHIYLSVYRVREERKAVTVAGNDPQGFNKLKQAMTARTVDGHNLGVARDSLVKVTQRLAAKIDDRELGSRMIAAIRQGRRDEINKLWFDLESELIAAQLANTPSSDPPVSTSLSEQNVRQEGESNLNGFTRDELRDLDVKEPRFLSWIHANPEVRSNEFIDQKTAIERAGVEKEAFKSSRKNGKRRSVNGERHGYDAGKDTAGSWWFRNPYHKRQFFYECATFGNYQDR